MIGSIDVQAGRWFARRLGLPETAGGYVTPGSSTAAFAALKAARDRKAGWSIGELGTRAGPPLTLYASAQVDQVNTRAADMLGLGRDAVRILPCDRDFRMRVDALRSAIARDIKNGHKPIAVIANAGSSSTGAIDSLNAIAEVCAEQGLWLHVDGTYGGVAALTDELCSLFHGIARADSIALEPCRWLDAHPSGGLVIVRDMQSLGDAFAIGPQLATPAEIPMCLPEDDWHVYERRIERDVALARFFYACVASSPCLEAIGPEPELCITCFRYVPQELRDDASSEPYINRLNEQLLSVLQLTERISLTRAIVDGRFCLRTCVVSFRTEASDIDSLIEQAIEKGELLHNMRAAS
jgi:glutamate/tyrosine decarboxylase-like PLP-dependent enzyme